MKTIQNRKFSAAAGDRTVQISSASLIRDVLSMPDSPQGGLTTRDMLMIADIVPKLDVTSDAISLEDAQMDHLKQKIETFSWNPSLVNAAEHFAAFVRDVRDAK